jgi:hypothetical protein
MEKETKTALQICSVIAVIGALFIMFLCWALPTYGVWNQGMSGKAKLTRATQERLIQVEQAKAERESAQYRADAIAIVGQAAKDYPEYRQQEYIGAFAEAMNNGKIHQIIYVPTEGSIPIMEAGQR